MKITTTVQKKAFELVWEELPQASQHAIIAYGFQRFVNDRANTLGKLASAQDKIAQAEAVVGMLKDGWTQQRGRAIETVETIYTGLILDLCRAVAKKHGKKWAELGKESQAKVREAVEAQKGPALMESAKALFAERDAGVEVDVEL